MSKNLILSILNVFILCIIILTVSSYFIYHEAYIGYVLILLGLICLLPLIPFRIRIKSIAPDMIFGVIDNGLLALLAVFGGQIGGVVGAIVGGVVGNTVSDGIAGLFEGYLAEKHSAQSLEKRTVIGTGIGKMSGCLLGAGFVLAAANLISLIK